MLFRSIGAKTAYAGGMWRIVEKHIRLLQEEFRYTYILGRDAYASAKPVYNPMFVGQSIHGTVIKTGGDAVRLHLKIDKKQDVSTAYPYPWVPDTGSFWKVPLRFAPAEKCTVCRKPAQRCLCIFRMKMSGMP